MAAPLQLGFTDYEQIFAKKRTHRQRFLDVMEATVPWEVMLRSSRLPAPSRTNSGSTAAQKALPMECAATTAKRKPRATALMPQLNWSTLLRALLPTCMS